VSDNQQKWTIQISPSPDGLLNVLTGKKEIPQMQKGQLIPLYFSDRVYV